MELKNKIYTYLEEDSAKRLLENLKNELSSSYITVLPSFVELLENTFQSTKKIILQTAEGKEWMQEEGIEGESQLEGKIKEEFFQPNSVFWGYEYSLQEQINEYQDPAKILILFNRSALKINKQTKTTVAFTGFSSLCYLLYLSEKGIEIDEKKFEEGLSELLKSLPPERIFQEFILGGARSGLVDDLYRYTSSSGAMDEFINFLPIIKDIRAGTENWKQEYIAAYLYAGIGQVAVIAKNFGQFKKGIHAIKELYQALIDAKLDKNILLQAKIKNGSYLFGEYPGQRLFSNLTFRIKDFETFLRIIKKATLEAKRGKDPADFLESIL